MRDVVFNQVDDVVLAGGFKEVNLDSHCCHRTNDFLHWWGNLSCNNSKYEYGVLDLDKRTLLSVLGHRWRRWKYYDNLGLDM